MSVVFIAISPGLDRVKCMNEEKFELSYEDHIAVCQENEKGVGKTQNIYRHKNDKMSQVTFEEM